MPRLATLGLLLAAPFVVASASAAPESKRGNPDLTARRFIGGDRAAAVLGQLGAVLLEAGIHLGAIGVDTSAKLQGIALRSSSRSGSVWPPPLTRRGFSAARRREPRVGRRWPGRSRPGLRRAGWCRPEPADGRRRRDDVQPERRCEVWPPPLTRRGFSAARRREPRVGRRWPVPWEPWSGWCRPEPADGRRRRDDVQPERRCEIAPGGRCQESPRARRTGHASYRRGNRLRSDRLKRSQARIGMQSHRGRDRSSDRIAIGMSLRWGHHG
jgi:hypothetical protein